MKKTMYQTLRISVVLLFCFACLSAYAQRHFFRGINYSDSASFGAFPLDSAAIAVRDSARVAWQDSLKAHMPDSATLAALRDSLQAIRASRDSARAAFIDSLKAHAPDSATIAAFRDSIQAAIAARDSVRTAWRDSLKAHMPDSATLAALRDSLQAIRASRDSARAAFIDSLKAHAPDSATIDAFRDSIRAAITARDSARATLLDSLKAHAPVFIPSTIAPNPVTTTAATLTFNAPDSSAMHTITIFDSSGAKLASSEFTGDSVLLPTSLNRGVYFYVVTGGGIITRGRFIVNN